MYTLSSIKDLHEVIVPHFTKYPILTVKRLAFIIFKQIIELLVNKQHLNSEGLLKIFGFRTLMNTGVYDELLSSFNSFSIEVTGKPFSVSNPTLIKFKKSKQKLTNRFYKRRGLFLP